MDGKSTRKVNQSNILCFILFSDFFSSVLLDSAVWSFFFSLLLFSEHGTVDCVPSFLAACDCKIYNCSLSNGRRRRRGSMFYLIGFELEVRLKLVDSRRNFGFCPVYVIPLLSHNFTLFENSLLLLLLLLSRHRVGVDCWSDNWSFFLIVLQFLCRSHLFTLLAPIYRYVALVTAELLQIDTL